MNEVALPETCCPTVWVRLGRAAYLGPSLRLREHSGSVHCFALGVDAPFTIHVDGAGMRQARTALVPPRTRHRLVAEHGRVLFAHVDPGSAWVRRTSARMTTRLGPAVQLGHSDELALAQRLRDSAAPDPLALLCLLTDTGDERDERVRAALALLRAHPDAPWTAARLANEVNLSASRFQHLFTAHTGTSFRRYRLWARMLHVAGAISRGLDLTTAATAAGFASPAHFSDAFRAMFGLSASHLLTSTTRVLVS
ncbi:helix-turn-helix transcriptional regulator [Umezawaea beigongshangensis]|uniref:helix-turn-helix transcriptional regulator n=1 Tax=Umezawaea beigongshangensis TaxID=2780383 RepID=UPI0018F14E92|nr:AraC family transcriptional regulator [Umezawaea beigongshangensis]